MMIDPKKTLENLKSKSKHDVFMLYCRVCLGRIHGADIKEMRKDWMIHDIMKAWRLV